MERIVMHIDVNNAFLSWTAIYLLEHGFKKDIRNCYAVIGGDEASRHGIVLAKSTPAKKLGIVTAETIYNAKKKCPNLEVYPMNFDFYIKKSRQLFKLLYSYTPDIEQFSIDEGFIEYTNVRNLYGDPLEFAYKLKQQIKDELGFTVNIGIANNKLCAKMASDFEKPDKVHSLYENEVIDKMYPLPVGDLLWIGKKTQEKLKMMGIRTIGQLANKSEDNLYRYFKNQAKSMIEHARGIDNDPVVSEYIEAKGMSKSFTLDKDTKSRLVLYDSLNIISNDLGISLRKEKKYASVIAVILKDKYFKHKTHQIKLVNSTNSTTEIYQISKQLLNEMWNGESIRLIGIRLDNLTETAIHQLSLFENIEKKEETNNLDVVMDNLKNKYGSKVINKASLLSKNKNI